MIPHPSTQRQRGYGYVNGQASTSVPSQTVPLYSQDGTSYPYTHHHANHHPHHHPHHQSIPQSHVSRGAPVMATSTAYATTGGHFSAPVPAVRNGLNALSESMPGQLNASVVTSYLDPSQDSMYLPVWGASFFPGGNGFGDTDGLVEDYHRRYEQESFGTYDECQSAHPTLRSNDQVMMDASSMLGWDHSQQFFGDSFVTSPSFQEDLTTSFAMRDASFDHGHLHPDIQRSPGVLTDEGSTGGPSVYEDSPDSVSVRCGWMDCPSFELYDRVSLWKHVKDCHHRSSREDGHFVCRWENCPDECGFKESRTLCRHINSQHAFRGLYKCRCGRRWGRPDKLKEHQARHPSH